MRTFICNGCLMYTTYLFVNNLIMILYAYDRWLICMHKKIIAYYMSAWDLLHQTSVYTYKLRLNEWWQTSLIPQTSIGGTFLFKEKIIWVYIFII